ncbi:MAG: DUF4116 domain-containing protein [Flavobacteriales bacterium]|nr:DUF4116 domain-containing protein [Flavobacteriales bacterium]
MATKEERAALLKAIEEDGPDVLAEAYGSLTSDRDFILAAVKADGNALEHADAPMAHIDVGHSPSECRG